jgi:membrane complex biogenesis BtpA family protein
LHKEKVPVPRKAITTTPLFKDAFIAMIGLPPLPGSPGFGGSEAAIVDAALGDLEAYVAAGVDAVLIENSLDLPYTFPPLDAAALRLIESIATSVRAIFKGPVGLQVLEAANSEALGIAARARLDFIRVEGYVFAHVGGAGLVQGCAGRLLRERTALGAESVQVFADVKKKHCAHALTADLTLAEHVRQADFFCADGIVITGPRTGAAPAVDDLKAARSASTLPVLTGSGMTVDNLETFMGHFDGAIVGSTLREAGAFTGALDRERLFRFAEAFQRLKSTLRPR